MKRIVFAGILILLFHAGGVMAQNQRSPLLDAQTLKQEIGSFNMAGVSDAIKVDLSKEMLSLINFYIKDGQALSYGDLLTKISDDTLLVHNLPTLDRVPQGDSRETGRYLPT
jgi:hypothetical protein